MSNNKNEAVTQITTNGSLGANFTSDTISTGRNDLVGIQIIFSGSSPTGTFTLQASIDGSTWTTISGSSIAVSADGDVFYSISDMTYPYVRVNYVRTSGTATVNIYTYKRET